jgi:hypothetical protein
MVVLVNPTAIFFFRDFAHLVDAHANFFVSNAATVGKVQKGGKQIFEKHQNLARLPMALCGKILQLFW